MGRISVAFIGSEEVQSCIYNICRVLPGSERKLDRQAQEAPKGTVTIFSLTAVVLCAVSTNIAFGLLAIAKGATTVIVTETDIVIRHWQCQKKGKKSSFYLIIYIK